MVKCFMCSFNFLSPQELFSHIQSSHQISGEDSYRCTICRSEFTKMWKYKRHLTLCFKKVSESVHRENVDEINANVTQRNLLEFESVVRRKSLELICKLASNMNIARNYVFEVVNDFNGFYSTILLEGFNKFVTPHVGDEEQSNLEYFIQICKDPFMKVKTEFKLDDVLKKLGVVSSLTSFDIAEKNKDKEKQQINEEKEPIDEENEHPAKKFKKSDESGVLMPMKFQFKKFFELPGVFKLIQDYANQVSNETKISHFINAETWKNKLKNFKPNDIVIPFHLFIDETQVNNALGSHRSKGLETCTYYSFPTIPPQYSSRLENIFVAQLFSSGATKKFGNFASYGDLIAALNELAREPVTLNVNGEEVEVYFVLGLILGDNKGVNDACGFAKSHAANHFCRFCRMHKKRTHRSTMQNDKMMRNEKDYEKDVKKKNSKLTGVNERSIVNLIACSHVTNSVGVDIMHDLYEGILHYNMCEIILRFIREGYFTLEIFNKLKDDLLYGETEAGNKSPSITMERLESKKLLMSASEMQCFTHHFGLIVGNFIPKEDPAWQFYIQNLKFLDLVYLPSYSENDLKILTETIAKMHQMYQDIFYQNLKPKHHFITHYPTLIKRYGPLYYISSMRYEAKHKIMKSYSKNTSCRINLSWSLARKLQYSFANRLLNNIGLSDNIYIGSGKHINLNDSDKLHGLKMSQQLQRLMKLNTMQASNVTINGIKFSKKLCITRRKNNQLELLRIMNIVYVTESISDIFFICQKYENVVFNEDYWCYELTNLQTEIQSKLFSAVEALQERKYPVSLHAMNDDVHRFRVKYF